MKVELSHKILKSNARGFEDLLVWQKARVPAGQVYRLLSEGALSHDFGLCDQMRRSAVSIASNIAEGHDRESGQDTIRFLSNEVARMLPRLIRVRQSPL